MTWGEMFWCGWQVATVAVSAIGSRLIGKHKSFGWIVLLCGSVMWTTWGVVGWQMAALLNGVVFGAIYVWNLGDWIGLRMTKVIWLVWLVVVLVTFTADGEVNGSGSWIRTTSSIGIGEGCRVISQNGLFLF